MEKTSNIEVAQRPVTLKRPSHLYQRLGRDVMTYETDKAEPLGTVIRVTVIEADDDGTKRRGDGGTASGDSSAKWGRHPG